VSGPAVDLRQFVLQKPHTGGALVLKIGIESAPIERRGNGERLRGRGRPRHGLRRRLDARLALPLCSWSATLARRGSATVESSRVGSEFLGW
jgi:hypothetical protein